MPRNWHLALGLVLAGLAAYANHVSNPMVFDDAGNIVENASIRDLWSIDVLHPERELGTAGRPLSNLTFAINYAIGGFDLVGYRVVNLAIHLACGLLLFGLARRLLEVARTSGAFVPGPMALAFCIALLWVVHPLNSEAVSYLTQRTESLMALCWLATLYACVRAHETGHRRRWIALAIVVCALGMGAKEPMATAPVMVLLVDRIFFFPSFAQAVRQRRHLYGGLAATWLILAALLAQSPRGASTGFGAGVDPWTYLMNQAPLIVRYLWLAVWPVPLVANYGEAQPLTLVDVWPSALIVTALGVLTIVALWRRPLLGLLGAWFFIALAPASSIVPVATEVGAERRMYLPMAALITLAVLAATAAWRMLLEKVPAVRVIPARALAMVLMVALAGVYTWRTHLRNREYSSAVTLGEITLARYPTPNMHHVLADSLLAEGRRAEAIPHLRAALPSATRAHYTLGAELFKGGQLEEAIEHLQAFVEHHPRLVWSIEAYGMLGEAHEALGNWEEAAAAYEELYARAPNDPRVLRAFAGALNESGISHASEGRLPQALEAFRRAIAVDPALTAARLNLALALCRQGRGSAAVEQARQVVVREPGSQSARELLDFVSSPGSCSA